MRVSFLLEPPEFIGKRVSVWGRLFFMEGGCVFKGFPAPALSLQFPSEPPACQVTIIATEARA